MTQETETISIANNDISIANNDISITNNDISIANNDISIANNDISIANNDTSITNEVIATISNVTISTNLKCFRYFKCCLCNNINNNDVDHNNVDHSLRKCDNFKKLKKGVTTFDYCKFNTKQIKSNDELGFCAAGTIPYIKFGRETYILLLVETRNGRQGLNFIAGGRECTYISDEIQQKCYPETSYETALSETNEELSEILTQDSHITIMNSIKTNNPSSVFWYGEFKIVLYAVKIDNSFLNPSVLKFNTNKSLTSEADNYKWIKLSDFQNYCYSPNKPTANKIYFHAFAKNIMYGVKNLTPTKSFNYFFK
jgi:hypothetical protein